MTNETLYSHGLKLLALLSVCVVFCIAIGCEKAPADKSTSTPKVELEVEPLQEASRPVPSEAALQDAPAQPSRTEVSQAAKTIGAGTESLENGSDVFSLAEQLHDLKAQPNPDFGEIKRVEAALDEAVKAQQGYPKQIGNDVELLAFSYAHVADDQYEMTFAFRTTVRLSKDYHVYVNGYVDSSHLNRVPLRSDGRPSQPTKWGFAPDPATSAWTPSDVIVLKNRVAAVAVPYRIGVNLLYKDQVAGWQDLVPRFVDLGWHAAV